MTAPPASPQRLTIHDQLLINLAGWLAVARFADPNHQLIIEQVSRVIPNVSPDHPLITPLAEAAAAVVRGFQSPTSSELARARLDLDGAVQAVFYARAAQAAAQIWPEENTQPGIEEPAHVAE